jgi:hypothetical protein
MIIAVSGPYSADTEEQRQANLDNMNNAAAKLLEIGHTPLIGVNAALPVVNASTIADRYEGIMQISMAVMEPCEAVLIIGMSKGVEREREHFIKKGLPVYYGIGEVPVL